MRDVFKQFKNNVLKNFAEYQVPVIALGADTSHEAVCLVFDCLREQCVAAYTFLGCHSQPSGLDLAILDVSSKQRTIKQEARDDATYSSQKFTRRVC